MRSLLSGIIKLIFGSFLFGVVFLATPKSVYALSANSGYSDLINYTANVNGNSTFYPNNNSVNVNVNGPVNQYGLVPFSSFDISLVFNERFIDSYIEFDTLFSCEVYVLFSSSLGGAYQQLVGSVSFSSTFTNNTSHCFNFSTSVDGIPTGIRIVPSGSVISCSSDVYTGYNGSSSVSISESLSSSIRYYLGCFCSFTNFSLDDSTGGGSSSTIINNTTGNLTPIGYSSLNFGLNGNCYFLGSSRVFQPDYLSSLMFSYDFANNLSGVISSSPLTFAMGGFTDYDGNTSLASPIAVIGDTRTGEYELTISLCLNHSPSSSQLSSLTNLSNWGFEFNRGYSGDQFPMPSNCRISYTNFIDNKSSYCYTSIYFYFTTPDYFDSFLIRFAPSLNDIRVGAFAFNKYTGTISDQLTQSNQQWDYQNPSHNSFSSANSSAASIVSAFSNIESDAFNNLDTAMSGAGVNDFNINVISTPLATVSAMINQTYNILPDLVKWLILAILVIGIFAVIISANNYVNKD